MGLGAITKHNMETFTIEWNSVDAIANHTATLYSKAIHEPSLIKGGVYLMS